MVLCNGIVLVNIQYYYQECRDIPTELLASLVLNILLASIMPFCETKKDSWGG